MSDEKLKPNAKTTANDKNEQNSENEANEVGNEVRNQRDNNNEDNNENQETENQITTSARKTARNTSQGIRFSTENQNQKSLKTSLSQAKNLPHSALYVLHTENGSTSLNRRCHLPRSEGVNVEARRKLIVASVLCLFFVICEIVGGVISKSLAVAADAAHTLTDFAGFMISLFAIWLAGRRSTDRLSFGWYRAEVIGALASVMTIWFVTAILVYMAIQRCISQDFEIGAVVMIITAVFGIITNVILGIYLSCGDSKVTMNCETNESLLFLTGHGRAHHHRRGGRCIEKLKNKFKRWSTTERKSSRSNDSYAQSENINVKAAYLHVLGDGLQSVGVLIAAVIIYIKPTWILADPICTFFFSVIILYTTFNILKDIIVVLMEGTPTYIDYNAVQATFEAIPGVKSVHHLRIWALSLDKIALAVHLIIEHDRDPNDILIKAEEAIHTRYNLFETTIQIEEEGYERPTLVN